MIKNHIYFLLVAVLLLGCSIILSIATIENARKLKTTVTVSAVIIEQQQDKITALGFELEHEATENARMLALLEAVFKQPMTDFVIGEMNVTVTAYAAVPEETDSTPNITADMTDTRVGLLAVSRDLLITLNYGQRVVLGDYGVFVIADTMNKRFTNRVDILHTSRIAAKRFGIKHNQTLQFIL